MKHNTPAQEVKSLETLFFTFFKIGLFTFGWRLRHDRPAGRRVHPAPQMAGQRRIPRHDRHRGIHPRTGGHQQRHLPRLQAGQKFPARPRPPWPSACRPSSSSTPSRCFSSSSPSSPSSPTLSRAFRSASSTSSSRQACGCSKRWTSRPFATGVLAAVMLVMVGLSLAGVSVSSILLILLSGAAGVAAWLIGRRKAREVRCF